MAELAFQAFFSLKKSFCRHHFTRFLPLYQETMGEFHSLFRALSIHEWRVMNGMFWGGDYRITGTRWFDLHIWLNHGGGWRFISTCDPWFHFAKKVIDTCPGCGRASWQPEGLETDIGVELHFKVKFNPQVFVIDIDEFPYTRIEPLCLPEDLPSDWGEDVSSDEEDARAA